MKISGPGFRFKIPKLWKRPPKLCNFTPNFKMSFSNLKSGLTKNRGYPSPKFLIQISNLKINLLKPIL
jgi:hypothetical protein